MEDLLVVIQGVVVDPLLEVHLVAILVEVVVPLKVGQMVILEEVLVP